jgi:RNA polymerase sigma factor for flagellar operon FliA
MLDFLRGQDPLTRRQRRAVRQVEEARRRVGQRLATEPRASQVAADAGLGMDEYARIVLDQATLPKDADTDRVGSELPDPHIALQERQARRALASAMDRLETRLRGLVVEHYVNERPLEEISRGLGVSSGRGSQLHKRALERLRQELCCDAQN